MASRSRTSSSLAFLLLLCGALPVWAQCDGIAGCVLTWSDEFDGTSLDLAKWEFQTGDGSLYGIPGWGNNELQWYQSQNAVVGGGVLTIQARRETVNGRNYTSSRLRSRGRGDFKYGRFEMRARLPLGQGLWPAFWMLPTNPEIYGNWAASGEIDIMESIGTDQIFGTIHYGGSSPANVYSGTSTWLPSGGAAQFHVYAVEWNPSEIRWYLDGQLYATQTSWYSTAAAFPAPFDIDFHLLLNLAVGGNFPGNPSPSTTFPQSYVVDYVRVYQQAPLDRQAAARCEAAKTKAVGNFAKCSSAEFAKAIQANQPVDGVRQAVCEAKLASAFARAEEVGAMTCSTTGDIAAVQAALDACVLDSADALGGAPGAGGVSAICQASKAKEAGKYLACRFKATTKAVRSGTSPLYSRCESRLASRWQRFEADTAAPCATTGDLSALQAQLDACHAARVAELVLSTCGNARADLGEECDDGNSTSGDGCSATCTIEPEYEQDFESLAENGATALGDNGWRVFGNVFTSAGAYLSGYGPYNAPNDAGGFCGIRVGEGGTEQGSQQLVVYSDYNNSDHGLGRIIESNVFRERTIVAEDIGKTFELAFDAKRGDLAGSSTANAFLKTLNPAAGYVATRYVRQITTSIPTSWARYSISLEIDASLEGQLLQYGFANTATNYEPSSVYYDNIVFIGR